VIHAGNVANSKFLAMIGSGSHVGKALIGR